MGRLASWLLPSTSAVLFSGLLFAQLVGAGERLLVDGDTGYHVRVGEYILATGSVPHHDIFSFHEPAPRWIAFEWLAQVALAAAHRWHGLDGVVGLASLLLALTYLHLYRVLRERGGNALIAFAVVALAMASSMLHWLARPHLFSLLGIAIFLGLLERQRRGHRRVLAWLPLLTLLWVNLHAAFVAGLVLIAVYALGAAVRHLRAVGAARTQAWLDLRALGLSLIACSLSALVNPNGVEGLLHPLRSLGASYMLDHVGEFRSPDFHSSACAPFALLLLLLVALLGRSDRKPAVEHTLLLVGFGALALHGQRHIPLFALVTAPLLADQLDALSQRWRGSAVGGFIEGRARTLTAVDSTTRGMQWQLLAVVVAALLVASGRLGYGFDPRTTPVAAVQHLLAEPISGRVFNEYEFGDFLIYSSWPRYRVFVDGRSDMYGDDLLKAYDDVRRLQPGWQAILDRYAIDWIFFDSGSALVQALRSDPAWQLAYADPVATAFVRTGARR